MDKYKVTTIFEVQNVGQHTGETAARNEITMWDYLDKLKAEIGINLHYKDKENAAHKLEYKIISCEKVDEA